MFSFPKLFEMQSILDKHIIEKHKPTNDVFEDTCLSLIVELSELANETRCFKYWSVKGPSEKEIVLEEYVDSIHFLLSLGNKIGYNETIEWDIEESNRSLTSLFLDTNIAISNFEIVPTQSNYTLIWKLYGNIAFNLGFTKDEIYGAYIEKNKKNFERQAQGY